VDDLGWLGLACDLARLCPPSSTAFSVGAVIVDADGREIARGFSREKSPHDHAEEAALAKTGIRAGASGGQGDLHGATVYSSLEPCGKRVSGPHPCAELIVASGADRVVFAWREPSLFTVGIGAEILTAAGVTLVELSELADRAREPNAHLL